ncbi:MAG TPA: hypothetical protein VNJ01_18020 [Bacteriovoracaceae bacterium]|nr:hypothetical protein [Bacteriovoracaceae bacterium]
MNSLCLLLLLTLAGCASVKSMRGTGARHLSGELKPELKISATYERDLSQEGYHLVKLYFLNLGERWQRIKSVNVTQALGSADFHVIRDQDLLAWKKSMVLDQELKRDQAKKEKKSPPAPEILRYLNDLSLENVLPGPLSLPGKLQAQRWLLIQTPGRDKLKAISIELTFIDSSVVKYLLPLEERDHELPVTSSFYLPAGTQPGQAL